MHQFPFNWHYVMRVLILAFTIILFGLQGLAPAMAAEPVRLQLKWRHAFQFAGYYAAKELGYYAQAGLDVELSEAGPDIDPLDEVLSGRADFGVGTSSLLLARKAGRPVVVLAVVFQHSPQVLIASRQTAGQSIHDLTGKRIMLEPQSEELLAYLKREGIASGNIKLIKHNFSSKSLVEGSAEAVSAYSTVEPYQLDLAGFAYQIYTPRSAGIDFYGDNLFTSEDQLRLHPARVKAFRAASLRGWNYAMEHPDEIIELILSKYASADSRSDLHSDSNSDSNSDSQSHLRSDLQFEARQMVGLMRTDLIEVGYMNPGRWRHIADTYNEIGMLPADFSLEGFLYETDLETDLLRLRSQLIAAVALVALLAGLAVYIHRINQQLKLGLTRSKQADLQLKVLSTAIDQSPTSVLITGPDAIIQYVNPQFSKETGYSSAEALGQTPRFLQSGETNPSIYRTMWAALRRGELWSGELINRRKSGELYWEEVHIAPVKDTDGTTINYVAVKLDITERKRAHDRLAQLAHYDGLTQLPNRALFFELVINGLALAKRTMSKPALMFVDLDGFKPVNDLHGHAAGDLVLKEVAHRMSACLRDSDTVGRIGGDEFVVFLPDATNAENAIRVAEKIREALNQPFALAEHVVSISSSIGIALYPEHGRDDIELAKNADFAMYQAKAEGRNRVQVFQKQ